MWTGSANVVPNPENSQHCTSASDYCWARFTLQEKDKIPAAQLVGLTTTQITNGELTNPANGYTAFIVPQQYSVAATNAIAPIVRQFVNDGGRFLSYYNGGTTSARNIGLTALNTQTITRRHHDAGLDLRRRVRHRPTRSRGASTRAGSSTATRRATRSTTRPRSRAAPAIPAATAPIRYKTGGQVYGYEVNSVGPGKLDGRPAVVDQPFGSGRAFLFASDPFFRAWHESVERQALNALIYPTGAVLPGRGGRAPPAPRRRQAEAEAQAEHAAALEPVAEPIAAAELPAIMSRPLASNGADRRGHPHHGPLASTPRRCARPSAWRSCRRSSRSA